MINNIINLANDVSFNRFTRIRSAISNSGYESRIIGSPTFYSMEINLPPLTKQQYNLVENELLNLENQTDPFISEGNTLPSKLDITTLQGDFTAISGMQIMPTGTFSGSSVTLENLDGNINQLLTGDYIQFGGSTKVYQVKSTDTVVGENDQIIVNLNQGLISQVVASSTIRVGNDVQFKFSLEGRPNVTIIPGPGYNYYQYDTFNIREIL